MKTHVTNPFLLNHYDVVLYTGYCELQKLFSYELARYYNAGLHGWNFDTYTFFVETKNGIKSVALSTGYRNMKGKKINCKLSEEYNNKAIDIINNNKFCSNNAEKLTNLINELILKTIE